MQLRLLVPIVFCAGCRFIVPALDRLPEGPSPKQPDMSHGPVLPAVDMAGGGPIEGHSPPPVDMLPPPDLFQGPDPCAAPAVAAGNLAAGCVIGRAPKIDGQLDDWAGATFTPLRLSNAEKSSGPWPATAEDQDATASATVALRWDREYLYVAVAVVDDMLVVDHQDASLRGVDGVELFFDGQHDRDPSYGADDWELVVTAGDDNGAFRYGTGAVAWPTGTKFAAAPSLATGAEYAIEVAVPWSALQVDDASGGRLVGFDLRLNDTDVTRDVAYNLPDRSLAQFNRAHVLFGCSDPYCRVDAFGTVQLGGR